MLVMEAKTLVLADARLARRQIDPGARVTAEDPTMPGFGQVGTVLTLLEKEAEHTPVRAVVRWANGKQGVYSRPEIRDVMDKPLSAQIGFGAVWEPENEGGKHV